MRELLTLDYDLKFKNKITNIHSISLETEYKLKDNILNGTFIVIGDYRTSSLSLNLTDFKYNVPFTYEFKDKVEESSISIEVEDFTYDINEDNLNVNIEYYLNYEVDEDIKEIDEVIENIPTEQEEIKEIEVIDFREEEPVVIKEEKIEEQYEETLDDNFITYHVYVVKEDDTLESILSEFKISNELLREYNDFDEIKYGMKLIIPFND